MQISDKLAIDWVNILTDICSATNTLYQIWK